MEIKSDADLIKYGKIAMGTPRFSPERTLWGKEGLAYIKKAHSSSAERDCSSKLYPRIATSADTVDTDNERIKWILHYVEVLKS